MHPTVSERISQITVPRKPLHLPLIPLWALGFFFCFTACVSSQVKETTVGLGWSNNSVNTVIFRQNAITTHEDHQFTAYYNDKSQLVLAKRKQADDEWKTHDPQYKGNTKDAHNAISIAVDGDGFLHVSWDHHDTQLRYAVSKEPLGLELKEEQSMTQKKETKVSYPQFYNLPDGDLLFFYRSGQSGRGHLNANAYDRNSRQWHQLHQNLIDGEDERNAYWQSYVDEQGIIHLSWVWRESWDVATNHDICYARSKDGGKTWEKSNGEKYKLPITAKSAEYAQKVPQNSSLINQTSMTTDAKGNPYIASYWNEVGESATQFQVVYLEDGEWKKESTDFRTTSFNLGGGGTKSIPVSRPEILVKSDNNTSTPTVYLLYRDEERGNKVSLAYTELGENNKWEVTDITETSVGQWEPNFDKNLFKAEEKLHIFVQKVTQIDGEGMAEEASTPVRILEVNKLPRY